MAGFFHLIRLLAGGAIRVENGDFLYCFSPTGNNGVSRLCTRVLFHIAANFHIRTVNGRPYGLLFFAERSFGQWQFPKTSAENNRAVAILKCTILMRIGGLPRPSIARPPAAAGKQFGLRAEVIVIAVARPVTMQKSLLHSRSLSLSLAHFYKRFCASPTGDNGRNLFCTRVLFHIAANFNRQKTNDRTYGSVFFAALSFRQWQSPKTVAGHNGPSQ